MKLNGKQKAAIAVLNMDQKTAASVFQHLNHDEIIEIGVAMAEIDKIVIEKETIKQVLDEFVSKSQGEFVYAKVIDQLFSILKVSLGEGEAASIVEQLRHITDEHEKPFQGLDELDARTLCSVLSGENPQTIALVLSSIDSEKSATILGTFSPTLQLEIIQRIMTIEETPLELIRHINKILQEKASSWLSGNFVGRVTEKEKIKIVAEILNMLGESREKNILEKLAETSPKTAEEIEELMFTFKDLVTLDRKSIQALLSQIDTKTLAMAIKSCDEKIRDHIMNNMSERAREIVMEEKAMIGMVPITEVEGAQKEILKQVRSLVESGRIKIYKGKNIEMVG